MPAEHHLARAPVRVEFLWDGSHVGAALFDEELLAAGPVAIFEVPGPPPPVGVVPHRFVAKAENGSLFTIEVLRVERRGSARDEMTTIVGFLVPQDAAPSSSQATPARGRRLLRALTGA